MRLLRLATSFRAIAPPRSWLPILLLFLYCGSLLAAGSDGYRVAGLLTYTIPYPDPKTPHEPLVREFRLFQVEVLKSNWLIHIEPLKVKTNGIVYWEAFSTADGGVRTVVALPSASNAPIKSIEQLRLSYQERESEEISFASPSGANTIAPSHANVTNVTSSATPPRQLNNVAVENYVPGACPPNDSSFTAVLWFAFAFSPQVRAVTNISGKPVLPRIWPVADSLTNRYFCEATWETFPQGPRLVHEATFYREGIGQDPSGIFWQHKNSSSGRHTLNARYEVSGTTNVGGFLLPAQFELKKFNFTAGSTNTEPPTAATFVTMVDTAELISADVASSPNDPGKTLVVDYRLASVATRGLPMHYIVSSNDLPSAYELKASRAYQLMTKPRPTRSHFGGWIVFVTLVVIPGLLVFLNLKKFSRKSG